MQLGKNTPSAEVLTGYVERIERIRESKKQLGLDEAAIMAEAKGQGFTPGAIRYVIKVRQEKPHDRQEREAMQDLYLHALGMEVEPPLLRFANLAAFDSTAREQVVERQKDFVPAHGKGHVEVYFGGTRFRLERQKDGEVTAIEQFELTPKAEAPPTKPSHQHDKAPVPDVDEAGAFELGRQYARDNRAVIDNPFPYGNPRRARFDEGWRKEAGGDGMGPDEK